jgi:hypothetical protein
VFPIRFYARTVAPLSSANLNSFQNYYKSKGNPGAYIGKTPPPPPLHDVIMTSIVLIIGAYTDLHSILLHFKPEFDWDAIQKIQYFSVHRGHRDYFVETGIEI